MHPMANPHTKYEKSMSNIFLLCTRRHADDVADADEETFQEHN
jgi:hypothetical protein